MERPLRIGVIAACPFPYPRGTPIRIQRLAENLARGGHEVHVATYHLGGGGVEAGVRVHRTARVPGYRKLAPGPSLTKLLVIDPLLTLRTARLVRHRALDVLYAHHYEGLLCGLAARRLALGKALERLPVVYDAHTLLRSELPHYQASPLAAASRAVGGWLDRTLPPRADYVISVSGTIRDRLVGDAIVDPDRIRVISNGVELEMFEVPEDGAGSNGLRRVVFAGNLAAYQGIDLLLRAFRRVRDRRSDVRLVLASDSPFDPYEPLAAELGVREDIDLVPGAVGGLPELFSRAAVAVNPRPDCDGIPMKLLNYMAGSRPVVSFARSAPGVVHGDTGWLVEGTDVDAFADGILHLLEHPEEARAIGRRARRHVEVHHGWEAAAREAAEIFGQLVERAGGRAPDPVSRDGAA